MLLVVKEPLHVTVVSETIIIDGTRCPAYMPLTDNNKLMDAKPSPRNQIELVIFM